MKRLAVHAAAAVSLVLLLLTLAAWVLSYYTSDDLNDRTWDAKAQRATTTAMGLDHGRLLVCRIWFHSDAGPHDPGIGFRLGRTSAYSWHVLTWQRLPVARMSAEPTVRVGGWTLGLRLWPIALVAAILPAMWLRDRTRRRRDLCRGRCGRCGYDLRASPDRCPECGEPVPAERREAGGRIVGVRPSGERASPAARGAAEPPYSASL